MNKDWQPLVEVLREELEEFGALLRLFDEQQAALLSRDSTLVLGSVDAIEEQTRLLQELRGRRELLVRSFALGYNRPGGATLRSLLGDFPAEARPLLEALIDQINQLVHRTRRRSSQNHLLLAREVETRQQILETLRPGSFTRTYSPRGQMALS